MNDKPANRHRDLRSLIRDDAYAASFQSLRQYRTALLEYVAPAVQGEPVDRQILTEAAMQRLLSELESCKNYYGETLEISKDGVLLATLDVALVKPGKKTPAELLDERRGQPAPDVAGLVEALDLALEYWRDRQQRYKNRRPRWVIAAESALAAHRKGGGV